MNLTILGTSYKWDQTPTQVFKSGEIWSAQIGGKNREGEPCVLVPDWAGVDLSQKS